MSLDLIKCFHSTFYTYKTYINCIRSEAKLTAHYSSKGLRDFEGTLEKQLLKAVSVPLRRLQQAPETIEIVVE